MLHVMLCLQGDFVRDAASKGCSSEAGSGLEAGQAAYGTAGPSQPCGVHIGDAVGATRRPDIAVGDMVSGSA